MVERRNINLTEEELLQKIIERIQVQRKRYTGIHWEYGKDVLHTMFRISECIEGRKGCKPEKLLVAAKVLRKLHVAKTNDGFVPQMHTREDDDDYNFMFYLDKLIELQNPVSELCPTCGQKIPGVSQNAVKVFLNE